MPSKQKNGSENSPASPQGAWEGAVPLLIFIATAAYYASFCRYGINLWDEGGVLYGGIRYLEGQKVFRDFLGYPPAVYWVTETAFRLFGPDVVPVRYAFAFISGLFGLFAYLIARRFLSGIWTAAAVLLVTSAPAVYYQRFYALVVLFCAWAVLAFLEDPKRWPWLVASAVSAYFAKVEVLLLAAPMFAWLFLDRAGYSKKAWAAVFAVVASAGLLKHDALFDMLFFKIQTEYRLWGNTLPLPWRGYQGSPFGFFTFWENMLFYLPFLSAGALFFHARGAGEKEKRMFFALAYFQLAAMALVMMRSGFDNLVRCLPLFFIAATWIAMRAVTNSTARWRPAAALLAAVLWTVYMVDFNYQNGFYTGSIGAVRQVDTVVPSGRAKGVVATAADAGMITRGTDWIAMATKKEDAVFAVPLNPIWYYLADRRNPTYFDWVLPGTLRGPEEEEKLVEALRGSRPALVLVVDIAIDNREDRRLSAYAPRVAGWIRDSYRYTGMVGYFQIWARK